MDTPWQIQLLGSLQAAREGQWLKRFRTQKAAALLARLAFAPHRTHPREELIDMLWPDADLDDGRNSFKQALASLRRQLEPPGIAPGSVLQADRQTVHLNPEAVTTDVAAFEAALRAAARSPEGRREALARALAIYQGELLPGFYEEWVLGERERLALAHERARHQLEALGEEAEFVSDVLPEAASVAAFPHPANLRLPLQWTRFFGRAEEIAQLGELLRQTETRLVTLTGAGGSGKTRLAIEAARRASVDRCGPVCFVALADLTDPALIPAAVAAALGLPPASDVEPLEQAAAALTQEPEALLILDNLEQFAEAAAPIVLSLLSRVPRLTILAASRHRLFVAGERAFPVPPLPLPPPSGRATSPEALMHVPSVQLFADRAQAARPDFRVTPRTAEVVAALCRHLEGIPLALELAASWAQALTPAQMVARLSEPSAPWGGHEKGRPERQRTLWATMAWSYNLLPPDLRSFWAGLSVFRGGWTAEAAQSVCGASSALSLLSQLQARSLVQAEEAGDEMRWRMLETLREFAGQQLGDADAREAVARRHARYFLTLAFNAEPKLRGAEQGECLTRLEDDHDNFRAALDWADGHDPETALLLASALSFFWAFRGYLREGRGRLERALIRASEAPKEVRAKALHSSGVLAYWQADYPASRAFYTEALALRRLSGEKSELLKTMQNLASIHAVQGDHDEAKALYEESLLVCRQIGDGPLSMPTLLGLAIIAQWQGQWGQARELYAEALEVAHAVGDRRNEAMILFNLGELERGQGSESGLIFERSLALAREVGDRGGVARALISLGYVAAAQDSLEKARMLLEEGRTLNQEIGDPDGIANALAGFGDIACKILDWPAAHAAYAESLAMEHELGDHRQITSALERLGILAGRQGRFALCARLLGAVQARREAVSSRMPPVAQAEWDAAVTSLRAALSSAEFEAAFTEGRALPTDTVVALALQTSPAASSSREADTSPKDAPCAAHFPGCPPPAR